MVYGDIPKHHSLSYNGAFRMRILWSAVVRDSAAFRTFRTRFYGNVRYILFAKSAGCHGY